MTERGKVKVQGIREFLAWGLDPAHDELRRGWPASAWPDLYDVWRRHQRAAAGGVRPTS